MTSVLLGRILELYEFWGGVKAVRRVLLRQVTGVHIADHVLAPSQVHAEMLESLLRSRMIFFTRTLAGSIVQRFGTDLVSPRPVNALRSRKPAANAPS